jgi:hypothetical protein
VVRLRKWGERKDGQRKEDINDITKKDGNNEKRTATKEISEKYNTERSKK